MKKISTRITALVMCALMCAALAACGGKAASVQDYLDKNKAALDAMIAEAESDGSVDLDIIARDNSMVYIFKYKFDTSSVTDIKDRLDALMEDEASEFKDGYAELKKVVSSAESIIVEYYDMNDTLITSAVYN